MAAVVVTPACMELLKNFLKPLDRLTPSLGLGGMRVASFIFLWLVLLSILIGETIQKRTGSGTL